MRVDRCSEPNKQHFLVVSMYVETDEGPKKGFAGHIWPTGCHLTTPPICKQRFQNMLSNSGFLLSCMSKVGTLLHQCTCTNLWQFLNSIVQTSNYVCDKKIFLLGSSDADGYNPENPSLSSSSSTNYEPQRPPQRVPSSNLRTLTTVPTADPKGNDHYMRYLSVQCILVTCIIS